MSLSCEKHTIMDALGHVDSLFQDFPERWSDGLKEGKKKITTQECTVFATKKAKHEVRVCWKELVFMLGLGKECIFQA